MTNVEVFRWNISSSIETSLFPKSGIGICNLLINTSNIVSLLQLRRIKDNEATVDDQITNSKDLLTNRNSLSGSSSNRMFNPGSGNNSIDTLRSRVSLKTEYVHSTQARIP